MTLVQLVRGIESGTVAYRFANEGSRWAFLQCISSFRPVRHMLTVKDDYEPLSGFTDTVS